ncbi:MAG: hypothetical protein ACRDF4_03290 [Rhabdochlamydiaceae bacterium]
MKASYIGFFVTGGKSWLAQSVKSRGSNVITQKPEASGGVDSSRELVAERMKDADVIVFTMVRPTLPHLSQLYPRIVDSPAFKNKRVYGFSIDCWQEGAYASERLYMQLSHILRQASMPEELRIFARAR